MNVGDTVKWVNARTPLGKIVLFFTHKAKRFCVVERPNEALIVCRVYEKLVLA